MIILAAGQGARLRPLTDCRPKCLVELGGRSLLDRQLATAREAGVPDVVAVGGYRAEQLDRPGLRVTRNPDFATTNMVHSLFCARVEFGEGFVVSYGDIAYGPAVLERMLADRAPISVAIDVEWLRYWRQRFADPLSDAESLCLSPDGTIREIGQRETDLGRIQGQFIGLLAFRGSGVEALREAYEAAQADERAGRRPFGCPRPLRAQFMTDLLQGMIGLGYKLNAVPISGGWLEIDSPRDLQLAEELLASGRLEESA